MVLDFPGIIDTEPVGEFDLIERLLEQPDFVALVPWPWQLVFVENAEFHGRSRGFLPACRRNCLALWRAWQAPFDRNMAKCKAARIAARRLLQPASEARSAGLGDRALRHHFDQIGAIGRRS